MVSQQALNLAISENLATLANSLGVSAPVADPSGANCVRDGDISYCLRGVAHRNEIELSVLVARGGGEPLRFSQDVVQEWLAEPGRAFMFNDSSVQKVARLAGETLRSAIIAFRIKTTKAVEELILTETRISDRTRIDRIKSAANEAWNEKDYRSSVNLYRSVFSALNRVEQKRLKLAQRELDGPFK